MAQQVNIARHIAAIRNSRFPNSNFLALALEDLQNGVNASSGAAESAGAQAAAAASTAAAKTIPSGSQVAASSQEIIGVQAGQVTASSIAPSAVGVSAIAAGAVTAPAIATGAVGSAALAAGAVTAPAIASGAVGSTALATGAVTAPAIASGAVETAAIAANAVTNVANQQQSSVALTNTLAQVATVTLTAPTGLALVFASAQLNNTGGSAQVVQVQVYKGTNLGTLLLDTGATGISVPASGCVPWAVAPLLDSSPGSSQQYTVYAAIASGTGTLTNLVLTATNLER